MALTLDQKRRVVTSVLEGLAHCHRNGVVHRNITPEHILLGADGQPRLMDFDYARIGVEHTATIAEEVQLRVDERYKAPELWADPMAASPASDIYSFGLVIYEMMTGQEAFGSVTEAIEKSCQFNQPVSQLVRQVPEGFDQWLSSLCAHETADRPDAETALNQFAALWLPKPVVQPSRPALTQEPSKPVTKPINYLRLPVGYSLTNKYVVQQALGKPGGFGVVYKVVDTLGDIPRAIKLILQDRDSVMERLKVEYRRLVHLPEHPYVVKVYDADQLPNNGDQPGAPYIVFEYIEGFDVSELIRQNSLTLAEAWQMAKQVAEGLSHLHNHNVFHCDIKPQNLIWRDGQVRIIDFNVSVEAEDLSHGGGSRKYLPPDLDVAAQPQPADLIDRDLYALGITLYRAVTGHYPWENTQFPPPGKQGRNPAEFAHCVDISDDAAALLLKLIAPSRSDRFDNASEVLSALSRVTQLRKAMPTAEDSTSQFTLPPLADGSAPTKSAFHDYLLTLYSQSRHSNSGTRGLDEYAKLIYVDTALDTELAPAVLAGGLKLVIITGNAGDGKTAFLQQLETVAAQRGVTVTNNPQGNGCHFELDGHRYVSNYDGSQDEGDTANDAVLEAFFQPYEGNDESAWPHHETRLIAINEGRLVDFLSSSAGQRFGKLRSIVDNGLATGKVDSDVAVINLNLRNVLASSDAQPESIMERLIARMVDPKVWRGCDYCALKDKCYVRYNVATFQDKQVGAKVIERLKYLYSVVNLRNQLHITLRDLRSALAFTLVGEHSCAEIRAIYDAGDTRKILQGYYFNAWRGTGSTEDRLLKLFADIDIADGTNVRLDRGLDFLSASAVDWLSFEGRGDYDLQLLQALYDELPVETSLSAGAQRYQAHGQYVGMLRRKLYFEGRSERWRNMLSYHSAERLMSLLRGEEQLDAIKQRVIFAINRGEGLYNPAMFNAQLAMQVRRVEKGTIRSYRVFPAEVFSIEVKDAAVNAQYIEHEPSQLVLSYRGEGGLSADLSLNLDLFEMLQRLLEGYVPSLEDQQGYYLSLTVFKNVLASAPYDEVLLTTNGRHFKSILRHDDGVLEMQSVNASVNKEVIGS